MRHGGGCEPRDICADDNGVCSQGRCDCRKSYGLDAQTEQCGKCQQVIYVYV